VDSVFTVYIMFLSQITADLIRGRPAGEEEEIASNLAWGETLYDSRGMDHNIIYSACNILMHYSAVNNYNINLG